MNSEGRRTKAGMKERTRSLAEDSLSGSGDCDRNSRYELAIVKAGSKDTKEQS